MSAEALSTDRTTHDLLRSGRAAFAGDGFRVTKRDQIGLQMLVRI
jgi:hypothetical protein